MVCLKMVCLDSDFTLSISAWPTCYYVGLDPGLPLFCRSCYLDRFKLWFDFCFYHLNLYARVATS